MEHSNKIVFYKGFDVDQMLDINHRPIDYIYSVDVRINNKRFPQPSTSKKWEASVSFKELDTCTRLTEIYLLAVAMSGKRSNGKKYPQSDWSLRGLYELMKAKDPLLKEISGKRIIIPKASSEEKSLPRTEIIICDPVFKNRPLWELNCVHASSITGYNAVMPVVSFL